MAWMPADIYRPQLFHMISMVKPRSLFLTISIGRGGDHKDRFQGPILLVQLCILHVCLRVAHGTYCSV
jgi:hypothetical protein